MGSMWNLMAGYGGMVSIGQQAFVGTGAYSVIWLADKMGVAPLLTVPMSALVCAALAVPTSYLVFRLVAGYFAIGTWVVSEAIKLAVSQQPGIGGGSGISLAALSGWDRLVRDAAVYWAALAVMLVAIGGSYALLRSRLGLGLTAIRDDPTAASSLGVRVARSKRVVYVAACAGFGAAGAVSSLHTLRVQPDSAFGVQLTAFMIFIVVIGGIGTIEGPILGAIFFWVVQNQLSALGSWYLVILGAIAIVMTLFVPRGLWGLIGRGRWGLFGTGYRLDM